MLYLIESGAMNCELYIFVKLSFNRSLLEVTCPCLGYVSHRVCPMLGYNHIWYCHGPDGALHNLIIRPIVRKNMSGWQPSGNILIAVGKKQHLVILSLSLISEFPEWVVRTWSESHGLLVWIHHALGNVPHVWCICSVWCFGRFHIYM